MGAYFYMSESSSHYCSIACSAFVNILIVDIERKGQMAARCTKAGPLTDQHSPQIFAIP